MHILIWESNLLKDKVIASNNVLLEGLTSGEKKIQLFDEDKKSAGFITLSLNVKQVPAKIISIDNINIEFNILASSGEIPFWISKIESVKEKNIVY